MRSIRSGLPGHKAWWRKTRHRERIGRYTSNNSSSSSSSTEKCVLDADTSRYLFNPMPNNVDFETEMRMGINAITCHVLLVTIEP